MNNHVYNCTQIMDKKGQNLHNWNVYYNDACA